MLYTPFINNNGNRRYRYSIVKLSPKLPDKTSVAMRKNVIEKNNTTRYTPDLVNSFEFITLKI
jgi:hypothetical protein